MQQPIHNNLIETAGKSNLTRREIIKKSAATGGILTLGAGAIGTASAKGKGGEAAITKDDYRGVEQFKFLHRSREVPGKVWKCDKGGQGILLAGWVFQPVDEDGNLTGEDRLIFTRDNSIDTDQVYEFTGKGQVDCGDFFLTPFSPAKD